MLNRTIVGIDLGTTYSSIAYINQHGKPEIITNREGERIMPSVVLFDGDSPIVGTIAKNSGSASPLNICQFVKRHMGEKDWKFTDDNDKEYTPEEVSALILKRLKDDAQTSLGFEINDAVITVPAYFNDAQRKSTQDAGKIAGLNVLRIINEPTAAALAYGIDQSIEQTILVYDLGGGTFDVTIMRITGEEIEVIATGGDKNLGGYDWDNRIMVYLNEQFQNEGGSDLFEDLSLQHDLRDKAEIAKKTLSSRDSAKVFLSAAGKNVSVNITREQFEEVTRDLLNRTESLMEITLEDANLTWTDIDKVLLVGGSTRMKCVPLLLERVSGKKPSSELHPDEIVSIGAALLGGIIQKKENKGDITHLDGLPSMKITDVNSHSLGIVAVDMQTGKLFNSIVMPKDTTIPSKASSLFSTVQDNQSVIEVEVTEGEEMDLDFVHKIGSGTITIPPYPKGSPVEVIFQYDNDGMIHVFVIDKITNKQIGELHIQRQANLTNSQLENMKKNIASIEVQ
ncbi:MAG: Hsp70 family protein [Candidatus Cloacimonas sp.]|jgi:molecular chaperone DnaK|nr:Hsp70 family protein [Candidatus Cloacimonas sp.]